MTEKTINYNDVRKVRDMKALNLLKERFDFDCRKTEKIIEGIEFAESLRNNNFCFIKESFEKLASDLFKTKDGRAVITKYINTITENKDLKKMHLLCECIRKADKSIDVDKYLSETISIIGTINKKNLTAGAEKLCSVLGEGVKNIGEKRFKELEPCRDALHDRNDLNEAIVFVGTTKKTPKNLLKYMKSCDIIKEHINRHDERKRLQAGYNSFGDIDKVVNEFNEKYGNELTESEQSLVKELLNNKNTEEVFNKYKGDCINKLTEKKGVFESKGDAMSSERMSIILEKVSKKAYNPETVNTDVFNLFEMTNSID